MQAITTMNLTQQDVFAAIQAQNITASNGGGGQSSNSGVSFSPPDGSMAGGPPDAGMGGGAPPDGGMGDMAGMGSAGTGTSTVQSQDTGASSGSGSSAGVPTILTDALIQYLEQIARS
jgi:multidrug efflux pump subunit AcrB